MVSLVSVAVLGELDISKCLSCWVKMWKTDASGETLQLMCWVLWSYSFPAGGTPVLLGSAEVCPSRGPRASPHRGHGCVSHLPGVHGLAGRAREFLRPRRTSEGARVCGIQGMSCLTGLKSEARRLVMHLMCFVGLSQCPFFLLFVSTCISGAGEFLSG